MAPLPSLNPHVAGNTTQKVMLYQKFPEPDQPGNCVLLLLVGLFFCVCMFILTIYLWIFYDAPFGTAKRPNQISPRRKLHHTVLHHTVLSCVVL